MQEQWKHNPHNKEYCSENTKIIAFHNLSDTNLSELANNTYFFSDNFIKNCSTKLSFYRHYIDRISPKFLDHPDPLLLFFMCKQSRRNN